MAGRVIYGIHAVAEALRSGKAVNRVYFAKESRAHGVDKLIDSVRSVRVPFDFAPQAKLNELCATREHQGVAAEVSPLEYVSLESCLASCPAQATLLVLDQVQHPRNVGMLLRSALGAGAHGVLLSARGGALLDDHVLRSSAGAAFHLAIVSCGNVAQSLRHLRDHGFWIYGLDAGGAESVFGLAWAARSALVVGNETSGIRHGVAKECDAMVRIPLAGGLESLNAAVAGSIALFQIASRVATSHPSQTIS